MTQTIYRPARRNSFTIVSNAIMNDDSLSAEAIGVLVYLLSRPDNWVVRIDQLQRRFNLGRDKMQSIMRELSDAGHARSPQLRAWHGRERRTLGRASRGLCRPSEWPPGNANLSTCEVHHRAGPS